MHREEAFPACEAARERRASGAPDLVAVETTRRRSPQGQILSADGIRPTGWSGFGVILGHA
jgi:hypothetical protein